MAETENYLTKANPTAEDWLEFNQDLFSTLNGEAPVHEPQYAPFADVDAHAEVAGVSVEQYFDGIREKVGPLGRAALRLARSEMDDAWHIVVVPNEESDRDTVSESSIN